MTETKQKRELVIKDIDTLSKKIKSLPDDKRLLTIMHASAFISGLEAAASFDKAAKKTAR